MDCEGRRRALDAAVTEPPLEPFEDGGEVRVVGQRGDRMALVAFEVAGSAPRLCDHMAPDAVGTLDTRQQSRSREPVKDAVERDAVNPVRCGFGGQMLGEFVMGAGVAEPVELFQDRNGQCRRAQARLPDTIRPVR